MALEGFILIPNKLCSVGCFLFQWLTKVEDGRDGDRRGTSPVVIGATEGFVSLLN